ncbi:MULTISPECIES: hypothetical protein [unclassified Mesorhizobium]|uniref:hypothetical protein n=2 Tax=unclassified Mesorhizobium TaxID=325217 RepID=UPI00333846F7
MRMLRLIPTLLALLAVLPLNAEATTKKYPKGHGTNCAEKDQACQKKCQAVPIDYNSVKSIQGRNECLNNCTIGYDQCLGAPARIQEQTIQEDAAQ